MYKIVSKPNKNRFHLFF